MFLFSWLGSIIELLVHFAKKDKQKFQNGIISVGFNRNLGIAYKIILKYYSSHPQGASGVFIGLERSNSTLKLVLAPILLRL